MSEMALEVCKRSWSGEWGLCLKGSVMMVSWGVSVRRPCGKWGWFDGLCSGCFY